MNFIEPYMYVNVRYVIGIGFEVKSFCFLQPQSCFPPVQIQQISHSNIEILYPTYIVTGSRVLLPFCPVSSFKSN
jgi:hypothetical protein